MSDLSPAPIEDLIAVDHALAGEGDVAQVFADKQTPVPTALR